MTTSSQQLRSQIRLSDAEIEARFEAHGLGITADEIHWTVEAIGDYRAAREDWAEPGVTEIDRDGALVIRAAQAEPGQARKDVVILDLGAARAVGTL